MAGNANSNLDELLVALLAEYKPHLQTHSHRMKTWDDLLKEFNRRSGLRYRQTRTLKRRFDKLCSVYLKYGSVKVMNFDTFKQLVFEFEHERQKSSSSTIETSNALNRLAHKLSETGEINDPPVGKALEEVQHDDVEDDDNVEDDERDPISVPSTANMESAEIILDDSEDDQTPLDSITVLPHTQMKRFRRQQLQENKLRSDLAHETLSNASNSTYGNNVNGLEVEGRASNEVSLQQQIYELQNSIEESRRREEEFRRQVSYKLDYIVSLLKE